MRNNTAMFLLALVCLGAAIYLALNHTRGWGWFAFFAILCITDIKDHKK